MVKWLRNCYEAAVLWIDWHGRITTLVAITIAVGGAALVNRGAAIWGQVHDIYLWVVSGLAFAVFLATTALIGRKMELRDRRPESIEIADQKRPVALPKDDLPPRLTIYGYGYPDVVFDRNRGIWREANAEDKYFSKGLIFKVSNDVYDDGKGVPAPGLRVQLLWRYDTGVVGPRLSPAPWLNQTLGIIDVPVGTTASLLVGTKSEHYWNGWANPRILEAAHPSPESEMLPGTGTLHLRMIGATNAVWFEAYLKWETDLTYNHPRFRQITQAEASALTAQTD